MSKREKFLLFAVFAVFMWSTLDCSDVSAPVTGSAALTSSTTFDEELRLLAESGVDMEGSKGVFSVEWNHPIGPPRGEQRTTALVRAIGFEEPVTYEPPFSEAGIDIGSVILHCPNAPIELQKNESPHGGVVYSNFNRPPGGPVSLIEFIPDAPYEFEVTGSGHFNPVTISINSPPSLIEITSHSNIDEVSGLEDLTITWNGGVENEEVTLYFAPHMPPRPGSPPHPPVHPGGILVTLDSNPGIYTLDASDVQEILQKSPKNMIVCRVSQINTTELEHDGGILRAVMHNSDHVVLVSGSL